MKRKPKSTKAERAAFKKEERQFAKAYDQWQKVTLDCPEYFAVKRACEVVTVEGHRKSTLKFFQGNCLPLVDLIDANEEFHQFNWDNKVIIIPTSNLVYVNYEGQRNEL